MRFGGDEGDTERLLQLARAGDGPALDKLLTISRRYLTNLARAQIGSQLRGKADPSDLVQEALLEIHRQFGRFRGSAQAEFAAWTRCILMGLIGNHVRRYLGTKRRDARLERRLAYECSNSSRALGRMCGDETRSPSDVAMSREHSQLLHVALHELPDHYREVIVLRHLEGLSFPEVAGRMGRSVHSIDKLSVRALSQLRRALREKV